MPNDWQIKRQKLLTSWLKLVIKGELANVIDIMCTHI